MYRYETHLHTSPASGCARASAAEAVAFYREIGYAGIFITNHFIDGNIGCDRTLSYREKLDFYFADYYEAKKLESADFSVFLGVENTHGGSHFLIYGLEPQWYYDHPDYPSMKKDDLLPLMQADGALVIQAHPFREASYIKHFSLFPRATHGVEIVNTSSKEEENQMAALYADHYGLLHFAGSDNHDAGRKALLGGVEFDSPLTSEADFVSRTLAGQAHPFVLKNPLLESN